GTVPNGPYGIGFPATGPFSVQVQFYDNATDETGFVVGRSERSDAGFVEIGRAALSSGAGQVVTFTDATVSSGTTYYYRAYAVNGPLVSSIAGPAAVHTPGNPALLPIGMPNGPYGLTAGGALT